MAIPSFQSVSHPDHKMIRPDTMKASGERISAAGSRHGRSAFGRRLRNTPSDSGAPAYISTLALVIRPTRDCQLGKGRKQMQPVMKAARQPTHGTPREFVHSNIVGT